MDRCPIVIAPNAMKGSLDAFSFADAIAKGLANQGLTNVLKVPVCDGGDGTARILGESFGAEFIHSEVKGPLGNAIQTGFYLDKFNRAYIDVASASGLALLQRAELNPFRTNTFGTGQLIVEALERGANQVYLGLGGSATVDGGLGALQALGVRFYDDQTLLTELNGAALGQITSIDMQQLHRRLKTVGLTLLVDVDNPLLGARGAARVFGPQKGASPADVDRLENSMEHWAAQIHAFTGIPVENIKGAGAAGGFAASFHALLKANIQPGADFVIQLLKLPEMVAQSCCVITGEGRIDDQTLSNKAPYAVLKTGMNFGKNVYVVCGINSLTVKTTYKSIVQLVEEGVNVDDAIKQAYDLVVKRSEELALIIKQELG
jgi:glycerate 2-kinase